MRACSRRRRIRRRPTPASGRNSDRRIATGGCRERGRRSARMFREVPMIEEAQLERVESGLTPVTAGWFVVNARDAAWLNNDETQAVCIFESDDFVLRGRPDLTEYVKPGAGFALRVLRPGRPAGMYHAESVQEDFLVLMGECVAIVEER